MQIPVEQQFRPEIVNVTAPIV